MLLTVIAFFYRDRLPDWAGKKAHDVERLASSNGLINELRPAVFNREYYQIVFNETRTTFHYVAGWLEFGKRAQSYLEEHALNSWLRVAAVAS